MAAFNILMVIDSKSKKVNIYNQVTTDTYNRIGEQGR